MKVTSYVHIILAVVVFRQQKEADWRLLKHCWKPTVVCLIAETTVVGHQLTVFQQMLTIRCIHCCPDVLLYTCKFSSV